MKNKFKGFRAKQPKYNAILIDQHPVRSAFHEAIRMEDRDKADRIVAFRAEARRLSKPEIRQRLRTI